MATTFRGSGFADDNANVALGGLTFKNVNNFQDWPNNAVRAVPLAPITSKVTLGSLTSIDVSVGFGGGTGGDNWDIAAIKLDVTVTTSGGSIVPLSAPAHTTASPPTSVRPATLGQVATAAPVRTSAIAPSVVGPSPWTIVPSPNADSGDNVLNGVTCANPTFCVRGRLIERCERARRRRWSRWGTGRRGRSSGHRARASSTAS